MVWLNTAAILWAILFFSLLIWLGFYFRTFHTILVRTQLSISILIAFKGEWNFLKSLLDILKPYDSLRENNVFVADDSSNDSENWLSEKLIKTSFPNWLSPQVGISGKKKVQRFAMLELDSEWILLIDADTLPPIFFLEGLVPKFNKESKLVLVPVQPVKRSGFWNAFFDLDFLSLQVATIATARAERPILANGACLFVNRAAYLAIAEERSDWDYPHGDDMFLLFAIAHKFGAKAVSVIHPRQAFARSQFPDSFQALFNQRLKWVGKVDRLRNSGFQYMAWLILCSQFMLLSAPIAGLLGIISSWLVIMVIGGYFGFCGFLLLRSCAAFDRRDLMLYIFPCLLLYPIYLIALISVAIIHKAAKP